MYLSNDQHMNHEEKNEANPVSRRRSLIVQFPVVCKDARFDGCRLTPNNNVNGQPQKSYQGRTLIDLRLYQFHHHSAMGPTR